MSVKAAIDIGSNSIKLRVGRRTGDGAIDVLLDTTEVVQLGQGFVEGGIAGDRMRRALQVVKDMTSLARAKGAKSPRLVGTMALRAASNAGEFLRRVREATGLEVQVLSGEEEARYSWKGAMAGLSGLGLEGRDVVMFDTGGGSTEFVFGHGGEAGRIQSVPVGAVSLTEGFLGTEAVRQPALEAAARHVRALFREGGITRPSVPPFVIGVGGGVVAMASVKRGLDSFVPPALHGMALTRRDLAAQARLYAMLTLEERRNVIGLPPSRADVVLGSACIVLCALETLGVPSCTLSINGLRHGVLMELFE